MQRLGITARTLGAIKRKSLSAALVASALALPTMAAAETATVIVLDASGSMWGQIDGINKITIAQDVVRDILGTVPKDRNIGLLAYGHRRKGDCGDIELLVPPGPGNAQPISAATDAINPRGKTPLTDAVRQAATVLRSQEQSATVVLVTDGLETCKADPCAMARELEQTDVDFTAHVVGFGLSRKDGAAVSCIADETGGRFIKADNAQELSAALAQTVATEPTAPEPQPELKVEPKHNLQINVQLSPDSPPLERGEIDKLSLDLIRVADNRSSRVGYESSLALKVDAGDYILRAQYQGGAVETSVVVEPLEVSHTSVSLNAGVIDFRARHMTEGLIDPAILTWQITNLETGHSVQRYKPDLYSVFAEGQYEVTVMPGRNRNIALLPVKLEVRAGESNTGEFLLDYAGLRIDTVSESGEHLPNHFLRFELWSKRADGTRDQRVNGQAGTRDMVYVAPGDYLLTAEDWGFKAAKRRTFLQDLTLRAGQGETLQLLMPADTTQPLTVKTQ